MTLFKKKIYVSLFATASSVFSLTLSAIVCQHPPCACLLRHSGLTHITCGHQFCILLKYYDARILVAARSPWGCEQCYVRHTLGHKHTKKA